VLVAVDCIPAQMLWRNKGLGSRPGSINAVAAVRLHE